MFGKGWSNNNVADIDPNEYQREYDKRLKELKEDIDHHDIYRLAADLETYRYFKEKNKMIKITEDDINELDCRSLVGFYVPEVNGTSGDKYYSVLVNEHNKYVNFVSFFWHDRSRQHIEFVWSSELSTIRNIIRENWKDFPEIDHYVFNTKKELYDWLIKED